MPATAAVPARTAVAVPSVIAPSTGSQPSSAQKPPLGSSTSASAASTTRAVSSASSTRPSSRMRLAIVSQARWAVLLLSSALRWSAARKRRWRKLAPATSTATISATTGSGLRCCCVASPQASARQMTPRPHQRPITSALARLADAVGQPAIALIETPLPRRSGGPGTSRAPIHSQAPLGTCPEDRLCWTASAGCYPVQSSGRNSCAPVFDALSDRLQDVFTKLKGHGRLSEQQVDTALREVRLALLEADVNFKVVKDFVARVRVRAVGEEVTRSLTPAQQVIKIVHEELIVTLGERNVPLELAPRPPTMIMLAGLQGSGKTTTAAKLARHLASKGRKPLLVAADLQRPAAVRQLQVLGEQARVPVFAPADGSAPAAPVAVAAQARTQADRGGQAGVIVAKLDGDARGGAALSVRAVTGVPIKFATVGEKLGDFEAFHPDRLAGRILGMPQLY